jgi:hypothetical protein
MEKGSGISKILFGECSPLLTPTHNIFIVLCSDELEGDEGGDEGGYSGR